MSWNNVKLGAVCTKIGSGATPKGGSTVYVNSGTSFIRSQNVYNLQFDYNGLVWINDDAAKKLNGVTIQKDDVLLNITGDSVARTCVVPEDVLPARVNQHVAIVRPDSNILNPFYLNYYLASPYMQSFMLGLAVGKGASRNAMTKDMISGFEVPCPPIDVQEKIVQILKAYDDLIINNKRQIKLLEEAAQRLYKEWFVDLRFPGYEGTEIVDGIPIEWRKGVLGDIAIDSGIREKKENRIQYEYYLPIDCLPKKSFAYTETNAIDLAESSLVAFKENDILFGAMRPYFHKVVFARDKGLTRSTCFVINAKQEEFWAYLLMLMFSDDTVNYATKISVGTTMPYARWKDMVDMPIIIPSKDISIKFLKIIMPITGKISKLSKQNIWLAEVRDRLLPKLMNGEIEV